MRIYGIEKLSMVDYVGHLACTVFTGGCNFCCPFCHNLPLTGLEGLPDALSEEEVLEFLRSRVGLLDAVCVSGGEPTLMKDLSEFCAKLKDLGYLVKLDSNGTNPKMLKRLIDEKSVDYVAMDIKSGKKGYPLLTGVENVDLAPIEQSVRLLMEDKVDYEFRVTLVDELHDEEDMKEMAQWLDGAKRLYLQRFVDSGACVVDGLTAVGKATAERYKQILEEKIKHVELRGY